MVIVVISLPNFIASAYTMPADQLVKLSNKQLCDKGQAHWDKNELDSALICFNIVANRAENKLSKDDWACVCGALTSMANIYLPNFFDFERAMQCILKAERIALKNGFTRQLANIYELKAVIESEKDNIQLDFAFNPKSFEQFRKAFSYSVCYDDEQRSTIIAINNLITIALQYHKLDLIENELETFQKLTIHDSIPGRDFVRHQNMAALFVLNQQYDSAVNELAQLENCIQSYFSDSTARLIAHENLYYVYRDMRNDAAALRELDLIERIAKKVNHKYALIEALLLKRDHYINNGDTSMANKYDLQYHKAKDEFMAEAKVAKVDEEKVLFKLNEANHEIKELSYKQRIQQTELIAMAAVAVLLLALLILAWLSHRRTKEKNCSLYEQNQQLLTKIDQVRQLRHEQERREKEQQALEPEPQPTSFHTEKYGRGKMEDDDITQVMDKVERVMDTATEIFAIDFSLGQLAELTGESRSRLSQAINQVPGRSFYSLLNEYRVREACRRMNDKKQYGGLTIEAIGQSVGFKSRSNFVATFKRITGLTPSTYLKHPPAPESPTTETHAD